jgi:hypothetical protein
VIRIPVLIGTNSSTTGYGVGTSVVIGYNNLNSLTDSTNLGVIVGTNCLNSYTESNMVNYPNNLTVAVGQQNS